MSAPTFTTHLIRQLHRDLGSSAKLDCFGYDPSSAMPDIENNENFASEYLLYNIARKRDVYDKADVPSELLRTSLMKWADAEYSCTVLNRHHRYYSPLGDDIDLFSTIKRRAKSIISSILVDVWPEYGEARFTGGATICTPRRLSKAAAKWIGYAPFNRNQSVVPNATNHLRAVLEENPAFARRIYRKRWKLLAETDVPQENYTEHAVDYFQGSSNYTAKLDYVPKDTRSVRMIMATGEGTMLVQSVFGAAIRRALAVVGVDLNDQNVNREWAEIGSYTGLVATVDLSSASDTISRYVVQEYLPARWYAWLDSCRDTHIQLNGRHHKLEKFASMGNGFCFELESLLFYGMARACTEVLGEDASFVSVYGDDIIIPSNVYDTLERFFLYNGFFTNSDKTFSGPQGFRESCGGHYYKGVDVTPFYIKREAITLSDMFHLYNQLNSWSVRLSIPIDGTLKMILDRIHPRDRKLVPEHYGSRAGLHSYVDGIILPVQKYSKRLQTFQSHTSVLHLVIPDTSERWCDRTRLCAWFMSSTDEDNAFANITSPLALAKYGSLRTAPASAMILGDIASASYKWRVERS